MMMLPNLRTDDALTPSPQFCCGIAGGHQPAAGQRRHQTLTAVQEIFNFPFLMLRLTQEGPILGHAK
jgi:hypothetical protein